MDKSGTIQPTAEVIAPLVVGLVGMLALVIVVLTVLLQHAVSVHVDQCFIRKLIILPSLFCLSLLPSVVMHVYPGIFTTAGLICLSLTGSGHFRTMVMHI